LETPSPAPYTTHSSIWCQSSRYPSAFSSCTQAKTSRLAAIASASLLPVRGPDKQVLQVQRGVYNSAGGVFAVPFTRPKPSQAFHRTTRRNV
ncbi:unnamed protein product, partial [Laminaria digitata]